MPTGNPSRLLARIKSKVWSPRRPGAPARPADPLPRALHEWARVRGMTVSTAATRVVSMQGPLQGRACRIEMGPSTRDYILGDELRARADMGLDGTLAAIVISRDLKESLEDRAYNMITDGDETALRPALYEEMRWLAAYEETGWPEASPDFWRRYAVLAGRREDARGWIDPHLVELLLSSSIAPMGPFVLALIRGRCYLRCRCPSADIQTLDRMAEIFAHACERSLSAFAGEGR